MSPGSRSKSKDKTSARVTKEQQQKASSKPSSPPVNAAAGVPSSAYDPVSRTFHTLEITPTVSSPPPQSNGRFRTIDETDDHSGSSLGTGAEYDSISNNDSCSGESEDQKEKTATTATRLEAIPGCDNDKRDKIRQKNERKHQRQRERRAQELRERCNGYLMARKLEVLAQQLVAMGFSSERATMALILNEGRVEESVAWLFEGGLEDGAQQQYNIDSSAGQLKIDIAEELARIADMEIKYKCSRQDVERALVACEGDLDKVGETLRAAQKQELPKLEGTGDPPAINSKPVVSATQSPSRTTQQSKANISLPSQQRRETERDSNYTKVATLSEPGNRNNLQSLRKSQQKSEWVRPQAATEKKWPNPSSSPSVSYPLASPPPYTMSLPTPKSEARYVLLGTEGSNKNIHTPGTLREPVIMMQRPQSVNAKQNSTASFSGSSPPAASGWYPNGVSGIEGAKMNNMNLGQRNIPNTNNISSNQFYQQTQLYQPFGSSTSVDSSPTAGWGFSTTLRSMPSSLGLFTGWGAAGPSGSSSPVDWSNGESMSQCDYKNIDWSVESSPTSSKVDGLWLGLASYGKGGNSRVYDTWSVASAGAEGSVTMTDTSSAGSHEWTSPFAGKDLLSIPRQFVTTSPSL